VYRLRNGSVDNFIIRKYGGGGAGDVGGGGCCDGVGSRCIEGSDNIILLL